MRGCLRSVFIIPFVLIVISQSSYSQSNPTKPQSNTAQTRSSASDEDTGRVGAAVKVSTLGGGAEVAVRVTHRTNVRAGFNVITYSRGFNKDGIAYKGQLDFKTFEAHYDIFPWAKSFHISGGVLAYAADPITATALVPGNQSFTLGGITYFSDPAVPVTGNGKIVFNRAAPTVTFGFGNLVPRRKSKHFSIPVEFGVVFQGSPKATLGLAGNVCDSPGVNCRPVASDPTVQSQIVSEQNKLNNSMSFFKVYPIISVGFGYKF
jgi:hypothetical protein